MTSHKFRPGDRVVRTKLRGMFITASMPIGEKGTVIWQDKRSGHYDHAIVLKDNDVGTGASRIEDEFVPEYLRPLRRRMSCVCIETIRYTGKRVNPDKLS